MSKLADAVHDRLTPRGRVSFKHMAGQALKASCQKSRKPGKGGCCCNCAYHYSDHSHPLTDGVRCGHIRGWICGAPELGFTSGWGKHGFCECHTRRAELQKLEGAAAVRQVVASLPPRLREAVETDAWFAREQKRRVGAGGGR